MYDVIIVGAGPAGLSAALALGRARRQVLVCDGGQPRNAASSGVHNYLSHEGIKPSGLLSIGREELAAYPTVEFLETLVTDAYYDEADGYVLTLADDSTRNCRKLILATGMRDILPTIEGIEDLWGRGVYHCPHCQGWELRDQPIIAHGNGESGYNLALHLTNWSESILLCTDGPDDLSDAQLEVLARYNILIEDKRIAQLTTNAAAAQMPTPIVVFEDGEELECGGIFVKIQQEQTSDLAERLGCVFTIYGTVQVDESRYTGLYGLFVVGDASRLEQKAIIAAADGLIAAMQVNDELVSDAL